jgi:CheY-like chemotaxis protein
MRILIAEDDQVLADGLLRTLRSSGAVVSHVANGSEADTALADQQRVRPADSGPGPAQGARAGGAQAPAWARLRCRC